MCWKSYLYLSYNIVRIDIIMAQKVGFDEQVSSLSISYDYFLMFKVLNKDSICLKLQTFPTVSNLLVMFELWNSS